MQAIGYSVKQYTVAELLHVFDVIYDSDDGPAGWQAQGIDYTTAFGMWVSDQLMDELHHPNEPVAFIRSHNDAF